MLTIVPAITATTMPTMAYINAFLAAPIFSGLPAEVRYIIPATINIIVERDPIIVATVFAILSKSSKIVLELRGFLIVTPDTGDEDAKPSAIIEDIRNIKNLFILKIIAL